MVTGRNIVRERSAVSLTTPLGTMGCLLCSFVPLHDANWLSTCSTDAGARISAWVALRDCVIGLLSQVMHHHIWWAFRFLNPALLSKT